MFIERMRQRLAALASTGACPAISLYRRSGPNIVGRLFAKVMKVMRRARRRRRTAALVMLSDHLLRDIGMNRTDAAWWPRKNRIGESHE
jgi:uncharacterized protein YjiS (DUF1127 family)